MSITYNQRLQNVAVIGAGGKMGRGISLVLLKLILDSISIEHLSKTQLILVDNSLENLQSLRKYLKEQLLKHSEKNITKLRHNYQHNPKLIDNSEIIQQFLEDGMAIVQTSTDINCCQKSELVFEAVFENLELKTKIYKGLKEITPQSCFFFSNTSSIPISEINAAAILDNRIIGFHFYNPPAIQKLVEVIRTHEIPTELLDLSDSLIEGLGKVKVPSNDIAGFIGNGHFIREGLSVIRQLDSMPYSKAESIYLINEIIAKTLVRPMGMFQLIDYVGLDVFEMICSTMGNYLDEDFQNSLIPELLGLGIKGGQFGNGTQKDGIFKYEKNKIIGVIDTKKKTYVPISDLNDMKLPEELTCTTWKETSRSKNAQEILQMHFKTLNSNTSTIAKHAHSLLKNYIKIAQELVNTGVTDELRHVDAVLQNGFYHVYGPGSACLSQFREALK